MSENDKITTWIEGHGGQRSYRPPHMAEMNLRGRNLAGADFEDANLGGADFEDANLAGANFRWAVMSRTKLAGAMGLPEISPFPIDVAMEAAVTLENLDMMTWHSQRDCGTVHCRAGWAVTLHPQGKELEKEHGTSTAAAFIYNACSVLEVTPDWHESEALAMQNIQWAADFARLGA